MAKEVLNDVDFPPVTEVTGAEWFAFILPDGTRGKINAEDLLASAGGGGGMVAPTILNSYYSRTSGGLANQTIAVETPNPGEVFIAVMVGFASTFTFPSGFDVLYNQVVVSNQRIALAYKIADGTETSLTFSRSSDRIGVSLLHVDAVDIYALLGESNLGTGLPFARSFFSPAWGKEALFCFAGEFDQTGIWSVTSTDGLLVDHPLPPSPDGGNHTGYVGWFDNAERARAITGTITSPGGSAALQVAGFAFGKGA